MCAAENAASARDSALEARSEYYTAEEMAEFAKPKKKKVRTALLVRGHAVDTVKYQTASSSPDDSLMAHCLLSMSTAHGTDCAPYMAWWCRGLVTANEAPSEQPRLLNC